MSQFEGRSAPGSAEVHPAPAGTDVRRGGLVPGPAPADEDLSRETTSLRFLLDATTVLALSTEFRDCLGKLAALAVPTLGDICLIDIEIDGSIERVAARHADPACQKLTEQLLTSPPEAHGDHPVVEVMRGRRGGIFPVKDKDFSRSAIKGGEHCLLVEQLGLHAYMCAPLAARDRVLGAITLVSCNATREFRADDLALAEDLARHAALVIDNARLLSERTRVARAFQASLLPPNLPQIPGLELAGRYLAAGEGAEVGGDFYDTFSIGRGAWVLAVGDVSGTGPEAAAVTGLVRHALHASAQRARQPADLLRVINAVLWDDQARPPERFCTATCAVVRPGPAVSVAVASAGHPPSLVLRSDGTLSEVAANGCMLGVDPTLDAHQRRFALSEGDTLVLYTDGLTEARNARGEFFSEGPLQDCLRKAPSHQADSLAQYLLTSVQQFTAGHLKDDLALLVASVPGDPQS